MRRLCTDSSCSYSGRSARQAVCAAMGVGLRPTSKGVDRPPNRKDAVEATGAGLRPIAKALETPPDPTATRTARTAVTRCVIRQKSAEGVVAQRPP